MSPPLDLILSGHGVINLSWIVGLTTFCVSAIIFLTMHYDELWIVYGVKQLPTLSLTGAYDPSESVFTAGLHLFGFLSFWFFILVYRVYHVHIENLNDEDDSTRYSNDLLLCCCSVNLPKTRLHHINKALLCIGMVFSVFMFLTGSIPLTLNFTAHSGVACIMFMCGIIHVLLFSATLGKAFPLHSLPLFKQSNDSIENADISGNRTRLLHKVSVFIILPLNITLFIVALAVFVSCSTQNCREFSVQTVVVLEYNVVLALGLYLEGFRSKEFLKARVGIRLVSVVKPGETLTTIDDVPTVVENVDTLVSNQV